MIFPVEEGCIEVDVYFSAAGGINGEPLYKDKESEGSYSTSLETLVQEFIDFHKDPDTGRIENNKVHQAFLLRDSLMKALEMLEDEIFD